MKSSEEIISTLDGIEMQAKAARAAFLAGVLPKRNFHVDFDPSLMAFGDFVVRDLKRHPMPQDLGEIGTVEKPA